MEDIGRLIGSLSNKIKREFKNLPAINKLDKVSSTNGNIIIYIYKHEGPVYQKDIEERFGITRSTVSKVLTLMEQKNLIIREEEKNDQRKKKIILTDVAIELSKEFIKEKNEFEKGIKDTLGKDTDSFIKSLKLLDLYFSGGKKE